MNVITEERQKNEHERKYCLKIIGLICALLCTWGVVKHIKTYAENTPITRQADSPLAKDELAVKRQHQRFIKRSSVGAIKAYRQNYQVLPSVTIAQAILESNWGKSILYRDANNPFGIKGRYHGKSAVYTTHEYVRNRRVTISARFRKYPTLSDAILDHDQAVTSNFIHQNHVMSYVKEAKLLQKNHYATDPHYAEKLIGTIKANHLNKYDYKALDQKITVRE